MRVPADEASPVRGHWPTPKTARNASGRAGAVPSPSLAPSDSTVRCATAVRVVLQGVKGVKRDDVRKAFTQELLNFTQGGGLFGHVKGEELYIVDAEQLLPYSPDEGFNDEHCSAWERDWYNPVSNEG